VPLEKGIRQKASSLLKATAWEELCGSREGISFIAKIFEKEKAYVAIAKKWLAPTKIAREEKLETAESK